MPKNKKRIIDFRQHRGWTEGLTIVMQLGLTMVLSIVFFFFVGYYIDKWLGIKGIFTSIFIILGIIGGGYTTYRQIMEITEDRDNHRHKNGTE